MIVLIKLLINLINCDIIDNMIEVGLFEPEIPQNAGTMIRFAACLGIRINLIKPFGFIFSNKKLKRAGMDYINYADIFIHDSYKLFEKYSVLNHKRIIKLIPRSGVNFANFEFKKGDIIVGGRESDGFPEDMNSESSLSVNIPCDGRSFNLAIATSMVTTEALRQVGYFI